MKRILSLLLMFFVTFSLCACGGSDAPAAYTEASYASPPTVPEETADITGTANTTGTDGQDMEEDDLTADWVDRILAGEISIEELDTLVAAEIISLKERDKILAALESKSFLEDMPSMETNSDKPIKEGIVYLTLTQTAVINYNPFYTVTVGVIDPETGSQDIISTFQDVRFSIGNIQTNLWGRGGFWDGKVYQSIFDPAYELVANYIDMADGSSHVGWLDSDGKFTDVSAMISKDSGDFGNPIVLHSGPFFDRKFQYFYFHQSRGKDSYVSDLMRVPIDDIRLETVEYVAGSSVADGILDYDNTYVDKINPFVHSPSGHTQTHLDSLAGWVDDTHALCVRDGMIYITDSELEEWTPALDGYEIVPIIENRYNENPVLSPDRKSVAFLSHLTIGADQKKYLFITSSNGSGEPKKVSTDIGFDTVFSKRYGNEEYLACIIDWIE